MRGVLAIARRELVAYFLSPVAYVVMVAFLLVQGAVFSYILGYLNTPGVSSLAPMKMLFGETAFYWIILLFVCPAITMKLLAEERRSGTIELLLTAPVTETSVVLGKFIGAWVFYILMWLPTVVYPLLIVGKTEVEVGPVAAGYLGTFLLGAMFISVGTLVSAMSKNQFAAAVVTAVVLFLLVLVRLNNLLLPEGSALRHVVEHMDLLSQMSNFASGVIDSRNLVYLLSMTLAGLFFSVKALEAKKWR